MTEQDIRRINELYHKSKTAQGLTEQEKEEQAVLRRQYIDAFKANLKANLENIKIQNPDGTITDVKEEHDKKYGKDVQGS